MGDEAKLTEPLNATQTQALLLKKLQETMEAGITGLRADIGVLSETVGSVKSGLATVTDQTSSLSTEFHKFQGEVEEKFRNESMRAKSPSSFDQEAAAELAKTKVELAETKAKHEALQATAATKDDLAKVLTENQAQTAELKLQTQMMDRILGNPAVKKIGYAALGVIGLALTIAGVMLNAKLAALQSQPTPQPQIIFVQPDGGVR